MDQTLNSLFWFVFRSTDSYPKVNYRFRRISSSFGSLWRYCLWSIGGTISCSRYELLFMLNCSPQRVVSSKPAMLMKLTPNVAQHCFGVHFFPVCFSRDFLLQKAGRLVIRFSISLHSLRLSLCLSRPFVPTYGTLTAPLFVFCC